ncbi:MAG: bifunctional DNA-formamidopyrimidine glycosylase/DNA-(apurinic or apyrimidinic site) lyase [Desulfuromonadales bacterium]|nr:bifunctional DNA-formamidopyrimidine glycosylase/DNA-(apurinic or apyrimidinic site) lyase [Desulfuromonadales bacterium]
MPELPEVETICRGIAPLIVGLSIAVINVREPRLRVLIPADLSASLQGRTILAVSRRAKYLVIHCSGDCTLLIHLGMSGTLRFLAEPLPFECHDHVEIIFNQGERLRFRDPRRFGAILLSYGDPLAHPALAGLGPEPLAGEFTADYLYRRSRQRTVTVKAFLMEQKTVVGVGNIYASEALHAAGIAPWRPAGTVSRRRYALLVKEVRAVLQRAIAAGGTTLRDFQSVVGKPGYFAQELAVYGRAGEKCRKCGGEIQNMRIGGRSSFYCSVCQS